MALYCHFAVRLMFWCFKHRDNFKFRLPFIRYLGFGCLPRPTCTTVLVDEPTIVTTVNTRFKRNSFFKNELLLADIRTGSEDQDGSRVICTNNGHLVTVGGVHFHIYYSRAHFTGLQEFLEKFSVNQRARHLRIATRDKRRYFYAFSNNNNNNNAKP
jgi:hypothetical protein